jgi:D-alanyl-D-alanine carboxypeptidase
LTDNANGGKMNLLKSVNVMLLLLFFLIFGCSEDSSTNPEQTASQIYQSVLDNNLEAMNGTGVSAAVAFQSGEIWTGTNGISYGNTPISKDMLFGIGSVTKTFIAALCLDLADEDVINLDDSIHKWLPDYRNIDSDITVRQLLYNTSGIYNISDNSALWDAVFGNPSKTWTTEEIISGYQEEPYSTPGSGWFYSNTNYILLGKIINEATGHSVSTELRNRFLIPLQLSSTYFAVEESLPLNVAHGWFDISGNGSIDDMASISRTGIYSVLWTSAAMFSTAENLARWSSALFGGQVLSASALNQMLTPCTLSSTPDAACGMGVYILGPGNNAGVDLIGYTGRIFGYLTSMFYLPDYSISVVVIINDDNSICLDVITTELILKVIEQNQI